MFSDNHFNGRKTECQFDLYTLTFNMCRCTHPVAEDFGLFLFFFFLGRSVSLTRCIPSITSFSTRASRLAVISYINGSMY